MIRARPFGRRPPAEPLSWPLAVPVIGVLCLSCWAVFIVSGWLLLWMAGLL